MIIDILLKWKLAFKLGTVATIWTIAEPLTGSDSSIVFWSMSPLVVGGMLSLEIWTCTPAVAVFEGMPWSSARTENYSRKDHKMRMSKLQVPSSTWIHFMSSIKILFFGKAKFKTVT